MDGGNEKQRLSERAVRVGDLLNQALDLRASGLFETPDSPLDEDWRDDLTVANALLDAYLAVYGCPLPTANE